MTAVSASVQGYFKKEKQFLINDLSAETGLSLFDARRAAEELMKVYECRLEVTPEGNLLYKFGKRKGQKTAGEIFEEVAQKAYQVFQFLFKLCISAILLIYFVVFIVVLIALIVMAIASIFGSDGDSDVDLDIGIGPFFGELFVDIFQAVFVWDSMTASTYQDRDAQGYPYKRYRPKASKFEKVRQKKRKKKGKPEPEKPQKRFVYSIYDFVFGEKRYQPDELFNQREIAAFLQQSQGILTIPDVMKLNGLPRHEAEKLFSDVLIRFEGEPSVSTDGVLYGDFREFILRKNESTEKVTYYWDEYEPEYNLTGNTKGRNTLIVFLNGFNLFFAFLGMTGFFNVMLDEPEAMWMITWLGWVPLVFSMIFFLIPTIRYFRLTPLRKARQENNRRKRVFKAVFLSPETTLSLSDVQQKVNQDAVTEALKPAEIQPLFFDLAHDLSTDTRVREDEVVFDFAHLREAQQLRNRLELGE